MLRVDSSLLRATCVVFSGFFCYSFWNRRDLMQIQSPWTLFFSYNSRSFQGPSFKSNAISIDKIFIPRFMGKASHEVGCWTKFEKLRNLKETLVIVTTRIMTITISMNKCFINFSACYMTTRKSLIVKLLFCCFNTLAIESICRALT